LEDSQLFLLDPLSLDFSSFGLLFLGVSEGVNFDSLVSVVLVEGDALGFLWFLFFNSLSFDISLLAFLDVLVLVDFIVEIADTSSASSFLSGFVNSASTAPPIEIVTGGGHFLGWYDLVVSFLSWIFLHSFGKLVVGSGCLPGSGLGLLDLGLLGLLSLLMGWVMSNVLFFGCLFWAVVVNSS